MTKPTTLLLVLLFLFLNSQSESVTQNIQVANLRTDRVSEPLGIDNMSPEFSWIIKTEIRSTVQSAYEILVADNETDINSNQGNVWSSGEVKGNQTFGIKYAGQPLKSFTRYFWKVKANVNDGELAGWSQVSWFETSALRSSEWKASWISDPNPLPTADADFYKETPNPLLRKEFSVNKKITSARLYIAGLGYSVSYINGQRVGEQMLDMPWTQYAKEIQYGTFDVTNLLQKGKNAIGVMLGNGWYNPMPIKMFQRWNFRDAMTVGKPCLKAQLRIQYSDGSVQTIVTDRGWQVGAGPILMNSVYLGETYDARLEQPGWDQPGFDDQKWVRSSVINGPEGKLIARYIPPVRITKVLKPVAVTEPSPGVYLFDFGQNFGGIPRLKVQGDAGTTVTLRMGEDKHKDGTLNFLTVIAGQLKGMWNMSGGPGCPKDPMAIIRYTLKGKGLEVYTPQFTFTSLRYVEVTGFPGKPDLNSIEGLRMNTDVEETGQFECSNEMFNQIQGVTKWTFLSNLFSIQSDCPAREKLGYGADIVTTAEAFSFNYDMSSFYRKAVKDFVNDVRPNGGMPEIAPNVGINSEGMGGDTGSPGWQLAFPYGMKVLYDFYGDRRTVQENYEILKRQVEFMHQATPDHIVKRCISDHASIDRKPVSFSATAFYYYHIVILSEFAQMLGKSEDVKRYQELAGLVKEAMLKTYLKAGTGIFDSGTQAAQLIAFNYNLVPAEEREKAFDRLLLEIFNKHKGHLSTGIYATKFMFDFFRQQNRNDVSYSVANQRTFPGWGNMLANGATTLYENWQYPDTVDSQNHPMFGSISEWYYRSLLGINPIEPGFRKFQIKPQPTGDLSWAKGSYDAVTGRIACEWKIKGTSLTMNVSVPANTKAVIYVPTANKRPVSESGNPVKDSDSLVFKGYEGAYAIFEAGSGDYAFESEYQ